MCQNKHEMHGLAVAFRARAALVKLRRLLANRSRGTLMAHTAYVRN